jgi:hypothetical protein
VALAIAFASSAVGSSPAAGQSGATWGASTPTSSVSAKVYVSAIECAGVAPHTYAGQQVGVELLGRYTTAGATVPSFDFAGYYGYCHGDTAVYGPQFLISNPANGMLTFKRGGFGVSPGDPLLVSVTSGPAGVTLTITNLNTRRKATVTGPDLGRSAGWAAGVMSIFGSVSGSPNRTGSVPLYQKYSPTGGPSSCKGPVPFAPAVFQDLTVNGSGVTAARYGIHKTTWKGTHRSPTAGVTPLSNGSHKKKRKHAHESPTAGAARVSEGSFSVTDVAPPKLGKTADITRAGGNVLVEIRGTHKFVRLHGSKQIPINSRIDAGSGSAQLTFGLPHGGVETGIFYDGTFGIDQNKRSGETTATLVGGDFARCSKSTKGKTASAADLGNGEAVASVARAKKKGKKVRGLWANAHGNFTTKGSNGAAAVLGTRWLTEDTCDGTYFKVERDKIKVKVFYPHPHYVIVTAGHSLFIPNILQIKVK